MHKNGRFRTSNDSSYLKVVKKNISELETIFFYFLLTASYRHTLDILAHNCFKKKILREIDILRPAWACFQSDKAFFNSIWSIFSKLC